MNRDTLIYRLNSQDELIYVNEEWVAFAHVNDSPELLPENVLGCSLWNFISDETTRQLYREILRQVRAGRSTNFIFRCDTPEYRRHLEMTISAQDDGVVQFATRVLRKEARQRQDLLGRYVPRTDDLLRICGWCKRVDVGGERWEEVEEAVRTLSLFEQNPLPCLTHGICEVCYEVVRNKLYQQRKSA